MNYSISIIIPAYKEEKFIDNEDFLFADIDKLGVYTEDDSYNERHIDEVLKLSLVDVNLVKSRKFKKRP